MVKYILPFTETSIGWFEVEANSPTEAIDIIENLEAEIFYKDGYLDYDEKDLYKEEEN